MEYRQITDLSKENMEKVVDWMYHWWGIDTAQSEEEILCTMKHSMLPDRLPFSYGAFDGERIVGIYQLIYDDLPVRPDIYPWLANLYVEESYRGQGIGKTLIKSVPDLTKKLGFKELFLYTTKVDLYEKYGWKYLGDIDTISKKPRVKRLYKLDIK